MLRIASLLLALTLPACLVDGEPEPELGTSEALLSFSYLQVAVSATAPYDNYADPGHPIAAVPGSNDAPYEVYVPEWPPYQIHQLQLLVMLHGNGGTPQGYNELMAMAARNGYFVVGLSYPWIEGGFCKDEPSSSNCFGLAREEAAFGGDSSSVITISTHPQDAIVSRLRAALRYLDATRPGDGWDAFLDGTIASGPRWSRITLAGHSLGAGYAAFLAHRFQVARVLMFSGPVDAPDRLPLESASWLDTPWATPAARFYGLAHTGDLDSADFTVPRVDKILADWATIGLPGAITSVDGAAPPYGGSHRLITSRCLDLIPTDATPCAAQTQDAKESAAHSAFVADGVENDPYAAAWFTMLTN